MKEEIQRHIGMRYQLFASQNSSIEKNINLIFYAEHGESEYGGKVLSKESLKSRNLEEVLENQIEITHLIGLINMLTKRY